MSVIGIFQCRIHFQRLQKYTQNSPRFRRNRYIVPLCNFIEDVIIFRLLLYEALKFSLIHSSLDCARDDYYASQVFKFSKNVILQQFIVLLLSTTLDDFKNCTTDAMNSAMQGTLLGVERI